MPLQLSEYACPRCKAMGKKSQIAANLGQLVCMENGEHKWPDTISFSAERPTKEFTVAAAVFAPQQNREVVKLELPIGLKATLDAKFGGKTEATMASILMQMMEGNVLVVGQTDLDRLATKLGKVPESSSELFGMVYAKTEEVTEAKQMVEAAQRDVQAYKGMAPGRVVVDLGEQYGEAAARAQNCEPPLPLEYWCAQKLKDGIRDNWF